MRRSCLSNRHRNARESSRTHGILAKVHIFDRVQQRGIVARLGLVALLGSFQHAGHPQADFEEGPAVLSEKVGRRGLDAIVNLQRIALVGSAVESEGDPRDAVTDCQLLPVFLPGLFEV